MFIMSLFSGCDEKVIEPIVIPTIEMHSGYSIQLTASSKNAQWGSDNLSVATVSSTGLVTAKGEGKAVIYTYSSSKEEKEVICYLDVSPRRNILFYIGADDNLINRDTPGKINKIRQGWQPDKGEMLIYADRKGEGASLLRVNGTLDANGSYGLDTLEVYGSENSADAATLKRVINKMVADYPADRYGMIFFSHASGWLPEGMLNRPLSMVIDGEASANKEMEYYDFASAIPDKQFDFIIFEACLMSDVLSMYEFRKKADYILASSAEIVSPGFYIIYTDEIMRLYETKEDIPSVVSGFAQSYYDKIAALPENDVLCSATLSLIKMDEMEHLASATKAVLQGISIDETTVPVGEVQSFDRPKKLIDHNNRGSRYFDFAHVIEKIRSDSPYKVFNEQLDKTVVWKAATKRFLLGDSGGIPYFGEYDGFFIERHSGLTIYIKQNIYPTLNTVFENSSWYKAIYEN
jgi:hypothetical protein